MVTGGFAPSIAGWLTPFASRLSMPWQVAPHRRITRAVHAEGGRICLQILHAGRYAYHPLSVAPSKIKSPITPFTPRALSARGVERTIADFVNCARKAQDAGYDGVEVMEAEGFSVYATEWWHFDYRGWPAYAIQNVRFEDIATKP